MTKNLDSIKFDIIRAIMAIDEESILTKINEEIQLFHTENELWAQVIKPTRATISLAEMKEEQNYIPIQKETFFEAAKEIAIEEPLEELLSQLD